LVFPYTVTPGVPPFGAGCGLAWAVSGTVPEILRKAVRATRDAAVAFRPIAQGETPRGLFAHRRETLAIHLRPIPIDPMRIVESSFCRS